jgi:hypothetical protein
MPRLGVEHPGREVTDGGCSEQPGVASGIGPEDFLKLRAAGPDGAGGRIRMSPNPGAQRAGSRSCPADDRPAAWRRARGAGPPWCASRCASPRT